MAVHITRAGVALTVGIIVLTGLLIGGLLWVKESGEQARREEAITIAEQNLEEQSDEGVALNGDSDTTTEQQSNEESSSPLGDETTDTSSDTTSDQVAVSELPQTGPRESASVLSVAVIVFAGTAYYQSRQAVRRARQQ